MGKLYLVKIDIQADLTIPVEAESEDEANAIAGDSYTLLDLDFDTWTRAKMMDKCPDWALNEIAEGSGGKTCAEVMDGDEYKEQRRREIEESWPVLPGFAPAT